MFSRSFRSGDASRRLVLPHGATKLRRLRPLAAAGACCAFPCQALPAGPLVGGVSGSQPGNSARPRPGSSPARQTGPSSRPGPSGLQKATCGTWRFVTPRRRHTPACFPFGRSGTSPHEADGEEGRCGFAKKKTWIEISIGYPLMGHWKHYIIQPKIPQISSQLKPMSFDQDDQIADLPKGKLDRALFLQNGIVALCEGN